MEFLEQMRVMKLNFSQSHYCLVQISALTFKQL